MSRKTSEFTIKDDQLVKALEITLDRLYEIIQIFDKDPSDEWELQKNDHFIWLSEAKGTRLFSKLGAFAIAKYMNVIEKKTLRSRIVEFVTGHDKLLRHAFVRQKVQENCTSLTLRNNRHFLSKEDIANILCTNYARLNKAFADIQKSDAPMVIYEEFDDIEGVRYYSLLGLDKLSKKLASELKNKDRSGWCSAVEVVASKTIKLILLPMDQWEKKIKGAMEAAKKRDKNYCQITNQRPKPSNKINLAVHHIFSKKHYPHLATSIDNLITLTEDVHKEFHYWNRGFDKPCTIDDLILFVNELHPEQAEASIKLNQIKKMLVK